MLPETNELISDDMADAREYDEEWHQHKAEYDHRVWESGGDELDEDCPDCGFPLLQESSQVYGATRWQPAEYANRFVCLHCGFVEYE